MAYVWLIVGVNAIVTFVVFKYLVGAIPAPPLLGAMTPNLLGRRIQLSFSGSWKREETKFLDRGLLIFIDMV